MQNILAVIAIFILLSANFTMITAGAQIIDRSPFPPAVYDLDGSLLDQITIRHQVILSQTFANDRNARQSFVAVFEVRDSNGVTVYLAWQRGTMAAGGKADIGVSWVADGIGEYEIRTFHVSSLTNPSSLGPMEIRRISVVQDAGA